MNDILPIIDDTLGARRPIIIAGPCSAESEQQVLDTARNLAANGIKIFRAGLWKPRTHPGGFEGVGLVGLPWMQRVAAETGMIPATEVANRAHTLAAIDAGINVVWIGARTSANPFAMQEIADAIAERDPAALTVLVKNPVNADLELWIGSLQRIYNAGVRRLGAIHRGFSAYGKHLYRNQPQWHIPIELRDGDEIKNLWYEKPMALPEVKCFNPSFDVTDHELLTGIVTEKGICRAPFEQSLAELFR